LAAEATKNIGLPEYLPAEHTAQLVEPVEAANVPRPQTMQLNELAAPTIAW
jgi:hypothetical protein